MMQLTASTAAPVCHVLSAFFFSSHMLCPFVKGGSSATYAEVSTTGEPDGLQLQFMWSCSAAAVR